MKNKNNFLHKLILQTIGHEKRQHYMIPVFTILLSLLFGEAYGEIELGNPNPVFMQMFKESLETIKKFDDLTCVQYFIKKILPDLFKGDFAGKDKMQRIAFSILLMGEE